MKKLLKSGLIFIISAIIIIISVTPAAFAFDCTDLCTKSGIKLNSKIDLLVSLDDGSVVIDKNASLKAAPASLTKMMTALVVLKNCKNLKSKVTVSNDALAILYGTDSSTAGLKPGEKLSVENLLYCMLIPSGNDAAVTLAQYIGGSQQKFVDMMNNEAKKLGCKNTHFDNAHGLDSPTHYSTAYDLAKIAQAALKYSVFKTVVSTVTYKVPKTNVTKETTLTTTNFLINKVYKTYYRDYIKGIKTGSTNTAGKCVVTYATKNGYNYLAVSMGATYMDTDKDGIPENQAFMDSIHMYEWAYSNLSYELVAKKTSAEATAKVNYSWSHDTLNLVPSTDIRCLVLSGSDSGSVVIKAKDVPKSINAPIAEGEKVCKADVIFRGKIIKEIDLVASQTVKRNWPLYIMGIFKRVVKNAFIRVLLIIVLLIVIAYILLCIRVNYLKNKKNELKIVKYSDVESKSKTPKKKAKYGKYRTYLKRRAMAKKKKALAKKKAMARKRAASNRNQGNQQRNNNRKR